MAMRPSSRSGSDLLVIAGIVLGAAAWAVALVAAAQPDDRQRFTLGVLRRDGVLLPFASFDGGDWTVPWPASLKETALPIALGDVPRKWWGAAGPGAKWTAWLADGDDAAADARQAGAVPGVLHQPARSGDGLSRRSVSARGADGARRTVSRSPATPSSSRSTTSRSSQPTPRRVLGLITDDFNEEEAQAASTSRGGSIRLRRRSGRRYRSRLEAFYRASETTSRGAWTTSYVEAVRSFPAGSKPTRAAA